MNDRPRIALVAVLAVALGLGLCTAVWQMDDTPADAQASPSALPRPTDTRRDPASAPLLGPEEATPLAIPAPRANDPGAAPGRNSSSTVLAADPLATLPHDAGDELVGAVVDRDRTDGRERRWIVHRPGLPEALVRYRQVLRPIPQSQEFQVVASEEVVADHLVVRLQPGTDRTALAAGLPTTGLYIRQHLPCSDRYLVAIEEVDVDSLERLREALADHPAVAHVETDPILRIAAGSDEPDFARQWYLHNTGQDGGTPDADLDVLEAWDLHVGDPDLLVAVIDTGIDYRHPDLADNIWTNPGEIAGNGVDDDGNGYIDDVHGWDFVNNDNDPDDDHWHGTHIAGTIGAVSDNDIGVAGICQRVSLMAVKAFNAAGAGIGSRTGEAIAYATDQGAMISNNSYGGTAITSIDEEVARTRDLGRLFTAAAGNDSRNNADRKQYPASYPYDNIIGVLNLRRDDSMHPTSNYGSTHIDLGAPGTDIYNCMPDGFYEWKWGTSMATPVVTGACALAWSAAGLGADGLSIRRAILDHVDPVADIADRCVTGGRVNVLKAIRAIGLGVDVLAIDDDNDGASSGNGDGLINPGERLELRCRLRNLTADDRSDVSIALDALPSFLDGVLASASIGSLAADGGSAELVLVVDVADGSSGESGNLVLRASDDGDSWLHTVPIAVRTSRSLGGSVTLDGSGVGGVTIVYSGPVGGRLTSAADGTFSATLPAGSYALAAQRDGWIGSPTRTVSLPASEDFAFTTHFLHGRISDEKDDSAIAGATVAWTGAVAGSVTSEPDGGYQAAIVAGQPGSIDLHASHPAYLPADERGVTIPPSGALDVALGRALISVSPASLSVSVVSGGQTTRELTVRNDGSRTLRCLVGSSDDGEATFDAAVGDGLIRSLPTPNTINLLAGITFDGTHAWLSNWDLGYDHHGVVHRYDPLEDRVLQRIDLNRYAFLKYGNSHLAWGAGSLWVASNSPKEVWRIDPSTGERQAIVDLGGERTPQGAIAFGDGALWAIASDGSLVRVDPDSATTSDRSITGVASIDSLTWMGGRLLGLHRYYDGGYRYELYAIDPTTGAATFLLEPAGQVAGETRLTDLASNGSQLFIAINRNDPGIDEIAVHDIGLRSWLTVAPQVIELSPDQETTVVVSCNGAVAGDGQHVGEVTLQTNVPAQPRLSVPVSFGVGQTAGEAPTITAGPSATPNPVTGISANLTASVSDDAPLAELTWNWSVSGPSSVSLDDAGAESPTCTFQQAGDYIISLTVTDADGLSASASTAIEVVQTASEVTVAP